MSQTSSRRTQADRPADEPESNPQPVAADHDPRLLRWHAWLWAIFIVAATFAAYWPAWHGEFVWDDAAWTTTVERHLDDLSGLWRIWTQPTSLQQYYPLTGTTFWLDHQLWGWNTLPYHLENILLHAASALMLWRLLARLEVPGAWLAGAIFALHPVMVESTAWITERKNVLSMLLFLASLHAYGRSVSFWKEDPPVRSKRHYVLALLLFLAALLSKITVFALPAVILLLGWWKRGRIRWKEDMAPALPFFAVSIVLGLGIGWLEKHHVGAKGADWSLSWLERLLLAGRAPWFYAGKLLWPTHQCFFYPKWTLNPASLLQWFFPLFTILALLLPWLLRKRLGRAPATAIFYFVGTLLPVLGFLDVYGMRYAWVGDHWVYLSSPGVLVPMVALATGVTMRLRRPWLLQGLAVLLLPVLAALTWRQSKQYKDMDTLWYTTLARNPKAWLAYNNLGVTFRQRGQISEAMSHLQTALELHPDFAEARVNFGNVLTQVGKAEEAIPHYLKALDLSPDFFDAHYNLGNTYLQLARIDEAVTHLQKALEIDPNSVGTHNNLGTALLRKGRMREAVMHYEKSLELDPANLTALNNVSWILATSPEPSVRNGGRALELAQRAIQVAEDNDPALEHILSAALAATGRYTEADETAERALSLARARGDESLADLIREGRRHYQAGEPLRDNTFATPDAGKP